MPLSPTDRQSFSLYIVSAADQINALQQAKAQIATAVTAAQSLDGANKNLVDPVTTMINAYQLEFNDLDGNLRTTVAEQNIQDAANKKLQNYFFPNDTTVTIPDLASSHNVWTQANPFASNYAIGKNYTEGYGSTTGEQPLITTILGYITSASGNTDIQNTTGQECIGTPPDTIVTFPAVQTLKTNLVTAINSLKTLLTSEVALIVTNDPPNQTINQAAIDNINNVILPALNTWLAYPDFNTAHGQTTCAGFNSFNANTLAPTKLHSVQLAALQSAINARSTFITTRIGQLNTILGSITQDLTNGNITASSGLYGKRYGFLALRINLFGGSLSKLIGLLASSGAQDSIIANVTSTKSTYLSIVPTSLFSGPGNGTSSISVVDASSFSPGDAVWVKAEGQDEIQFAVKSVSANMITLNNVVPSKYSPSQKARIYKDLT